MLAYVHSAFLIYLPPFSLIQFPTGFKLLWNQMGKLVWWAVG